jgi:hypothetical protein
MSKELVVVVVAGGIDGSVNDDESRLQARNAVSGLCY